MTIVELRQGLGWSQVELARRTRLSANTIRKAENGENVSSASANTIAEVFSTAYGRRILVKDIQGLKIAW